MESKLSDIDEMSFVSIEEVREVDQTKGDCTEEEIVLSDSMSRPICNIGVCLSCNDDENAHVWVEIQILSGTDK